jgi:preprotein translocase SecE subunit
VSEAVETVERKSDNRGAGQFIGEVREELTRVSFPSGDDVRNTTIIVVLNVIFFAIFLFIVDQFWVRALQGLSWLINKATGI